MQNVLALLNLQIYMMRKLSSILPKMQECLMKLCTVSVHGFSAPKLACCLL